MIKINWSKWYSFLAITTIAAFFVYNFESPSTFFRKKFERDISKNINAIVIEKFIDKALRETCFFAGKQDTTTFIFNLDKSGLFNYLQVGDSILKPEGDSTFLIVRNGKIEVFVLDY